MKVTVKGEKLSSTESLKTDFRLGDSFLNPRSSSKSVWVTMRLIDIGCDDAVLKDLSSHASTLQPHTIFMTIKHGRCFRNIIAVADITMITFK